MNYRAFFGLAKDPFIADLALDAILKTSDLTAVHERITYTVGLGAIALVTGEVGAGKSTALRWVAGQFHPSKYKILWVTATSGSILEVYRQLLAELDIKSASSSRAILTGQIRYQITNLVQTRKQQPVLIIDEASLLRLDVFAEVFVQIGRRFADQFQVMGEAFKGGLRGGRMWAAVILLVQPVAERLIQLLQGLAGKQGENLAADRAEESFDLPSALRGIGWGVGKSYPQAGADLLQVPGAESSTIVDIEFARQSPGGERTAERLQPTGKILGKIKCPMGDQPGVVVEKGDQVALAPLPIHQNLGTMHDIRLPDVIGELRLEPAPVNGVAAGSPGEPRPLQNPVGR